MIRFILTYLLLLSSSSGVFAQLYGNEWIDLDKPYYKMTVLYDGVYRLEYEDFINAGIPIDTIDPTTLQVWRRGEEYAIHVNGEGDLSFDNGDYLEFYGERNDGWQDKTLYTTNNQLNKNYNLYSDTSAYFITWGGTGKRMANVNVVSNQPVEPYYYHEHHYDYYEDYSLGQVLVALSYNSYWDKGEGWVSNVFQYNPAKPTTSNYKRYVFSGLTDVNPTGEASLEYVIVGRNNQTHVAEIRVDNDLYNTHTYQQYNRLEDEITIDINDLVDGSADCRVYALSNNINNDAQSIVSLNLRYARDFNMSNLDSLQMVLKTNSNDTSFIQLSNYPTSAEVFDITDPANVRVIASEQNATLDFHVTGTSSERVMYINRRGFFKKPYAIEKCEFEDDLSGNPDYLLVTHPWLYDGTLQYAAYRESPAGGGYRTLVKTVKQIFDQYSYGEFSPIGIKRFARYLYDNGSPDFLVLMGKGVTVNFQVGRRPYYRHTTQDTGPLAQYGTFDLIPTFGVPASDVNYSTGFLPNSYVPAIATGRIPVRDNQGVLDYLNKVKEHESLPYEELWRKNIVHLGGGIGTEAIVFKSFLDDFKTIAEGEYLGGNVTTFSKSGSDNIEFFNVSKEVNEGLNLITFFGHSSATVSDIDIGNVSNVVNGYDNKGKYPMLIINGCNSGNAYASESQGEDWIITPEKGAINFLGHSDEGYALQLYAFTKLYYTILYGEDTLYGGPVGQVQKKTLERYLENTLVDFAKITQAQQFNLQGDPANKMFSPALPDYFIDQDRVTFNSFNEQPITAVSDSFNIQLVVDNYGRGIKDTLYVCIDRTYNNGQNMVSYGPFEFIPSTLYQDTLNITIQSKDANTFGQNIFTFTLDCLDSIPELRKDNNVVTVQYYIPSSGLKTLYPKDFSVVGNSTINFLAQSTDPLIEENTSYIFQLDTNDRFNVPLMELETTARAFPVWNNINLPALKDSLVYYWRVRYKDISTGQDTIWGEASFMYIPGKEGWAQAHFPQFKKNSLNNVLRDDPNRVWLYDTVTSFIQASAGGNGITIDGSGSYGQRVTSIRVSGQGVMIAGGIDRCERDGAVALSFSQTTALPYHPTGSNIDYCGIRPRIVEDWSNGAVGDFANYVQGVPEGDYILFMAYRATTYSTWNNVAKDSLKALGAQLIDGLQNGDPYILFVRKGDATPIYESTGAASDTLMFSYTLKGQQNHGEITSTLIGPASEWGKLYQQYKSDKDDKFSINLYGVDLDNTPTLLTTFNGNELDSLDLKNDIVVDPDVYPFLRLEAVTEDSTDLSIPQLKQWIVLYEGVPEGIMEPAIIGLENYELEKVYEGDTVEVSYAFVNISEKDFVAPLIVKYTITDNTSGKKTILEDTLSALSAGDTLIFVNKVSTKGLGENNTLHAFVNPYYQSEEYYDNNVLVIELPVEEDLLHPILDVTFDGKRILNGEIVSAEPIINIAMQDENEFLLKGDTLGINVFLRRPCNDPDPLFGCEFERINLSNSNIITLYPATNSSDFKIEYRPEKLSDGVYELQVQVADAAGNESGLSPYKIKFEVINKSSITNVLPYPNPFSTSVRFVFTLTGSEIPENMKIQIMTISGKVVREIMKEELGVIRIGNNITDYAWDGRDEFGDELANGTYLYRVVIKDENQTYEHRETKADQAFKKGFGKMVKIK